MKSILAGIAIAIGAYINLKLGGIAGAVFFSVGLYLVCNFGLNLYTGKVGYTGMAQNFPANKLIFYAKPDFTKPEECTEEWLIEHQSFNEEMTEQEFGQFYIGFTTAWNNQEHER